MKISDLYSKRQKKLRDGAPDIYIYDNLPNQLRVQIVLLWRKFDTLGLEFGGVSLSKEAVEYLCEEYGVFALAIPYSNIAHGQRPYDRELMEFFLNQTNVDKALDVVEAVFNFICDHPQIYHMVQPGMAINPDMAIKTLNARFLESNVGYQLKNKQIIRIDSGFLHQDVVKPALHLLNATGYSSSQENFLAAHEYYRKSDFPAALNECNKALESTLKIICENRDWKSPERAGAAALIDICLKKGLIPEYWREYLPELANLLKRGVPKARNELSGHGQGNKRQPIPRHVIAHALHLTAAAIVFLVEAEKSL